MWAREDSNLHGIAPTSSLAPLKMPRVGVEPTHPYGYTALNPVTKHSQYTNAGREG